MKHSVNMLLLVDDCTGCRDLALQQARRTCRSMLRLNNHQPVASKRYDKSPYIPKMELHQGLEDLIEFGHCLGPRSLGKVAVF